MTKVELSDIYRDYVACLNKQDWPNLGQFVDEEVHHNGERIGLTGSFTENVFYEFRDEQIEKVWSVIDKTAIESQH